jgi:hypothetical protein
MSPCRILGPVTLLWATCRKFLFLACFSLGQDSDYESAILILETSRVFWTFSRMMWPRSLFSRLSTRAHMLIMIAYSDPLQEDEINEYKVKGIQMTFYF